MQYYKKSITNELVKNILEFRSIVMEPEFLEDDLDDLIRNEFDEKWFVLALRLFLKFHNINEGYLKNWKMDDGFKIDKYSISRIFKEPALSKVNWKRRLMFYKECLKRIKMANEYTKSGVLESDERMLNTAIQFREEQAVKRAVLRHEEHKSMSESLYVKMTKKKSILM